MKKRVMLYADDGMMLTDGEHYVKSVHLSVGADESLWREITREEYEEIVKAREEVEA